MYVYSCFNSSSFKIPEQMEIDSCEVFAFILLLLSPDLLCMLTAPAAEQPGIVLTVFSGVVKIM